MVVMKSSQNELSKQPRSSACKYACNTFALHELALLAVRSLQPHGVILAFPPFWPEMTPQIYKTLTYSWSAGKF